MATLQTLANVADPRIRGIWNEANTQLSSRLSYAKLGFKDIDAEIQNPQYQNFSGHGLAAPTGEGQPYNTQSRVQGYNVTISPSKFTDSALVTEEMLRFNLWPEINNEVQAVAHSLNGRIDTDAAKIFYLGFGTTYFTGGDGVALFSASHPMKDGSTQSNTLGNTTLSYDNLKTACQELDRMYDDKGVQMLPCRKLRLVVAREKKERAEEVLRSIGNPDNANRVSNVFNNGEGYIDMVVADWIPATTYNNYWYVMDMERAAMQLKMVWAWRPKFDDDKVITNGSVVYTGSVNYQPGFSSFQWIVGANSTT